MRKVQYSSKPGCATGHQAVLDEKLLRVASMEGRAWMEWRISDVGAPAD